ncbi:hypothetical protein [Ottowia sp. VDI28]|uniref:hypothetical protein n=1 Tax=Ottowia sp. VDI28 TaxID=3133968 RepID=UPI003C2CB7DF
MNLITNRITQELEPDPIPDPNETSGQLWARHEAIQTDAASLFGQTFFFSCVDVCLGLCLAWANDGARLEALSKSLERQNVKARLDMFSKHVATKFPAGSKRRTALDRWIERAHAAREQRNLMVLGRWVVEARRHKIVNVLGLPSGSPQSTAYTIAELRAFNEELGALEQELARLCTHWPV